MASSCRIRLSQPAGSASFCQLPARDFPKWVRFAASPAARLRERLSSRYSQPLTPRLPTGPQPGHTHTGGLAPGHDPGGTCRPGRAWPGTGPPGSGRAGQHRTLRPSDAARSAVMPRARRRAAALPHGPQLPGSRPLSGPFRFLRLPLRRGPLGGRRCLRAYPSARYASGCRRGAAAVSAVQYSGPASPLLRTERFLPLNLVRRPSSFPDEGILPLVFPVSCGMIPANGTRPLPVADLAAIRRWVTQQYRHRDASRNEVYTNRYEEVTGRTEESG